MERGVFTLAQSLALINLETNTHQNPMKSSMTQNVK